ncbi:hypothetical protein SAMN04488095_1539 [Jannaschia pohangensis]|uniref:Uncharacterized protein n=1 Tax=Jannaschia pohangensis TaxID=390807 RepID=A0A1I3LIE8_9RHOB|nr:hypothetical protein SAMN04488095_1539 [Jannaschia pohangensis]
MHYTLAIPASLLAAALIVTAIIPTLPHAPAVLVDVPADL